MEESEEGRNERGGRESGDERKKVEKKNEIIEPHLSLAFSPLFLLWSRARSLPLRLPLQTDDEYAWLP